MRLLRSCRYEEKLASFMTDPQPEFNGLSYADYTALGTYNAERGRGIMHTPEWQAKMTALQERFDAAERERYLRRMQPRTRERG